MYIAVAGKGSSGKSTIAALAARWLVTHGTDRPLVIDADPHQSLCLLLGMQPLATLGWLRSQYERALITGRDPALRPDETRTAFAERLLVGEALHCGEGVDLLALGQWDLPGSQCTPNRVLGYALAQLLPQYPLTLIDHEAGVEHIGRFSEVPIDRLIVVATPESLSLAVARRIMDHARAVGRQVHDAALVLNRVQPGDLDDPAVRATLADLDAAGLPLLAALPESAGLRACSRAGHSPLTLDAADPWRQALTAVIPALFPVFMTRTGWFDL
jgi:CO dehydrogenase maturation factor